MASKSFFKTSISILAVSVITGIGIHFMFHIHCISIQKPLYFNLFSAVFCGTFLSAGIATSVSMHVFSILFLII
jgi:hypothetical protein